MERVNGLLLRTSDDLSEALRVVLFDFERLFSLLPPGLLQGSD